QQIATKTTSKGQQTLSIREYFLLSLVCFPMRWLMKVIEYALMSAFAVVILFALFSTFMAHAGSIWDTVLTIK
ncbi:hypothetical protein, partial [Vibrio breoganii]|uniref:hypothetical protein n=2 Tax=Vibrio breoganii TaxID=553239 RepID=UPI001A7E1684